MKKTSRTKIARTYAAALFEAAVASKSADKVYDDVAKLSGLLKENQDFSNYLSSPLWEEKDKVDVLKKTAKLLDLHKETLNCLEIVNENHRVADLGLILEEFERQYYQNNNVAEVEVETVKKLTVAQDKNLKAALKNLLAQDVVINYQINPSVLGGLRVKSGSKMFDDSLSTKLNYLENLMKGK